MALLTVEHEKAKSEHVHEKWHREWVSESVTKWVMWKLCLQKIQILRLPISNTDKGCSHKLAGCGLTTAQLHNSTHQASPTNFGFLNLCFESNWLSHLKMQDLNISCLRRIKVYHFSLKSYVCKQFQCIGKIKWPNLASKSSVCS